MVVNIGSTSTPEFLISTAAKALLVPPTEERKELHVVGYRMAIGGKQWFKQFQERFTTRANITSAEFNSTFLSVTVNNPTNDALSRRVVAVSPIVGVRIQPHEYNDKHNWPLNEDHHPLLEP